MYVGFNERSRPTAYYDGYYTAAIMDLSLGLTLSDFPSSNGLAEQQLMVIQHEAYVQNIVNIIIVKGKF